MKQRQQAVMRYLLTTHPVCMHGVCVGPTGDYDMTAQGVVRAKHCMCLVDADRNALAAQHGCVPRM